VPHCGQVELRNSQAVLAAERRLFWLREEQRRETLGAGGASDSEIVQQEELPFLSDVQVAPEVEALLRTLFRHLDPSDSGTVDAALLHSCLLTASSHGLLPTPVQLHANPCSCSEDTIWDRLLRSLATRTEQLAPRDRSLTWGEVWLSPLSL
jgi:hypothetical protein